MNDKFEINNKTRVIATCDDLLLVTNNADASLSTIDEYAVILNSEGNIVSPYAKIGFLTKYDVWEPTDVNYYEYNNNIDVPAVNWLMGLAVGDAFGVPVEFMSRFVVKSMNLNDMIGNLTHNVDAGTWSDDTSMTIATMDSIIEKNGKIDYEDIMNKYVNWFKYSDYTSINRTFGVGNTVLKALKKYVFDRKPAIQCGGADFKDNGNGSLMRICPISIYCIKNKLSELETVDTINKASSLTHANDISKMGCFIYTEFLRNIYFTKDLRQAFTHILEIDYSKYYNEIALKEYSNLLNEKFFLTKEDDIKENGYVVTSLEAAIYSLIHTDNYADAIKCVVNLGYDTDTNAAITGSIAGVLYGVEDIPIRWLEKLKKIDYLEDLCDKFDLALNHKKDKSL